MAPLLSLVGVGLGGLFITGVAIVAMTHGALGETRWVRVSMGIFVLLGALHGLVRYRFRRAQRATAAAPIPKGVALLLWSMCALVAAITYLMEAKPF